MDPKNQPTDPKHQETFNRIMNTPTTPTATDQKKQDGAGTPTSPVGPSGGSPFTANQNSGGQTGSDKNGSQLHPGGLPQINPEKLKESYEVPTVGIPQPTQPQVVGVAPQAPSPQQAAPAVKPVVTPAKTGGKSPILAVVFALIGIILLGVYALVWAVIFGLPLPFLPLQI